MRKFLTKLYVKFYVVKTRTSVNIEHALKMTKDEKRETYKDCFKKIGTTMCVLLLLAVMSSQPFFANYSPDTAGAIDGFKDTFNDIYGVMMPAVSIIAAALAAYNIVVIMTSKNQKKCDTAFTWIKAIAITWLCFACISVVIKIALELFNSGKSQSNGILFTS